MEAETEPIAAPGHSLADRGGVAREATAVPASGEQSTAGDRLDRIVRQRPLRVGVVSGLGYRNVKGSLEKTSALLRTYSKVPHHVVESPEDMASTLESYEQSGIDIVAVSGGDGTVSMVAIRRPTPSVSPMRPVRLARS